MVGIPMLLITGQVPLSQIGTDAFQEADMSGICRAVTKHSFLVK
jgi:acetolactate synthase-1/2/3 large subunit